MCFLGLLGTKAQQTITIKKDVNGTSILTTNNTNGTQYYPVYTNENNYRSVSQMIYVEDQIKAAAGGTTLPTGEISHIAFVMGDVSTVSGDRQWRVYIKTGATKSAFSSSQTTYDWEELVAGDLCFDSVVSLPQNGKEVVIKLQKNIPYNGGNIVVCVCEDSGAEKNAYRAKFQWFNTTDYRSLVKYSKNVYNPVGDLSSTSGSHYKRQESPVIKFTIVPSATPPYAPYAYIQSQC